MNDFKDSRHWSNQSATRRDEVHDAFESALLWVLAHRRRASWVAGGAAALIAVLSLAVYAHRARRDAAWNALSQAESAFYSGRVQDAQGFVEQASRAGGSPAGLAALLEGDMHYPRGEYAQAVAAYDKAALDLPEPLKPYALADKVFALEAAGKSADCVAAARTWTGLYPDQLLAPMVESALARCLDAGGQIDAYKTTLQKITIQYPGTPWAGEAAASLRPFAPK